MQKLIGLEDLPNNFKVVLDDNFRKGLFEKAVKSAGGFLKLAERLEIDHSSLCKIRRGYRLINSRISPCYLRIPLLKKLLELSNINLAEGEKNIIGLITNKAVANVKLPIYPSKKLAAIIGHSLGDGHVSSQRFKYVNKGLELVDEVDTYTSRLFGSHGRRFYIWKKNCYGVEFAGVVGHLLGLVGSVHGRKVENPFGVPKWIKNGSSATKAAFVKALFDDEGSVVMGKKQQFLSFSMYKDARLIEQHIHFLNELREMLIFFGIIPAKVLFKKNYKNTKEFGFRIYGKDNLRKFLKIGFTHVLKQKKIIKIIGFN